MNIDHLRDLIIRPTLRELGMYSENAVELVIGTGMVESGFHHLKQINGPAVGFYQCEPATYEDITDRYLKARPAMLAKIMAMVVGNDVPGVSQIIWNLKFATAICRIHYWMKPDPIPDTEEGRAAYWKQHYNTPLGRGTVEKYIAAQSLSRS